jgi:hypothetical protein
MARTRIIIYCIVIFLTGTTSPFADKSRILDTVTGIDENGEIEYIQTPLPRIVLSKKEIYHYETIEVLLYGIDENSSDVFHIQVVLGDKVSPSAGMEYRVPFVRYDHVFRAVWLPGWNEKEGEYEIHIYLGELRLKTDEEITFMLKRRLLPQKREGLSVVDLEMNRSIKDMQFYDPEGRKTDYRAILDWARFMNADMIWILSGETTTFKMRNSFSPWDIGPLENLQLIKKIAGNYSIEVGAYIMSFYVPGKHGIPDMYRPGIGYNSEQDTLYDSKHISLSSEERIKDIVALAEQFQKDPDIHYIGFDFIRTGRGDGYELASQVIEDTNIVTPPGWEEYSTADKIKWFARKIEVERDPLFIEKWRWWRAHRVAEIVRRVIEDANITKPVWVYTLGWNHGKEHGQDPIMFFDAGVTYDAVMLYEANQSQFARLLVHWNEYIEEGQGNIIVGSSVDYTLLDSDYLNPPEEFFRRNREGYRNIVRNGFAKGIFFHDIARAFWGRKGQYTFRDYAIAHLSSVYSLRKDLRDLDLLVDLEFKRPNSDRISGVINIKNNSTRNMTNIRVELVAPKSTGTIVFHSDSVLKHPGPTGGITIGVLDTFESIIVPFTIKNVKETPRNIIFRVEIEKRWNYYVYEFLNYVHQKRT